VEDSLRIGVVGDVHLHWGGEDVRWFDAAGYDVLLFVGDLGGYRHRPTVRLCRSIAQLQTPAIVIPGNHDGPTLAQLAGEVYARPSLVRAFSGRQGPRVDSIRSALGPVTVAGYSRHRLADDLDLVVGRPHSMGGPAINFGPFLAERFGVRSMAESAARLAGLVDDSSASTLLFLAHNGPAGLGDRRTDIWGCDFRADQGDQGDEDLRVAVEHAVTSGRRVCAVAAGHMHTRLRGGGLRTWQLARAGTLYVNAARVPRVFRQAGRTVRHHVLLRVSPDRCEAEEILVS